jgi:hypothetical protein
MARPTTRSQIEQLLRHRMEPLGEVRRIFPGPATDRAILDMLGSGEIRIERLDQDDDYYLGWEFVQ